MQARRRARPRSAASRRGCRRSRAARRRARRRGRARGRSRPGPRWRIARAIRSSASSATGGPAVGRTMPAIPHMRQSLGVDHHRGRVQVLGRDPPALDLARRRPRPRPPSSPTRGASSAGAMPSRRAPHQQVHPLVGVAEVELLLGLREAERLRRRRAARGSPPAGRARRRARRPAPCRGRAIGFRSARPSPPLTKKPWSYSSRFGRPGHGVGEPVGPRVLDQLAHPLLHVGRGEQLAVGARRHPPLLGRAVGALDHQREDDDPAGRRRSGRACGASSARSPGRPLADRLVAAPVAAEPLERVRDRLLDAFRRRALSASSRPRSEEASPTSRSGKPQAEDALGPERPDADPGDDARVDAAGDGDHRTAAAEASDGRRGESAHSSNAARASNSPERPAAHHRAAVQGATSAAEAAPAIASTTHGGDDQTARARRPAGGEPARAAHMAAFHRGRFMEATLLEIPGPRTRCPALVAEDERQRSSASSAPRRGA